MSEYLKPQSPLYHKTEDAYFYPLTTADQVMLENGERLNSKIEKYVAIDTKNVNIGEPNPVNADTLGGYSVDNFASKTFVQNKIAEAQLNGDGGNVDLSGYVSSDDLNNAINNINAVSKDNVVNNFTTTEEGFVADARALNTLNNKIDECIIVDTEDVNIGEINPVNANTLGGYPADEYVRKNQLTDFAPTSPVELNYSVVGSVEEPVNPTQNMIWIQTETPIGRVFFGNNEPNETFIEGDVWIRTGNSSSVLFNSLKIGNSYVDMVHPLSVKQYVDGIWIDEEAMSYQNGEWVEWAIYVLTLFNSFTTVRESGTGSVIIDNGTVTATTTGTASNDQGNVMYFSDKIIDLSEYKTLSFHVKNSGKKYTNIGFYSANTDKYSWNNKVAVHEIYDSSTNDYEQDVTVDLSNVNSLCYFAIGMAGYLSGAGTNIVVVSNIKLMK